MIEIINNSYILHTKHTTYAMRLTETGHMEHLYYGKRIRSADGLGFLSERHEFPHGDSISYDKEHPAVLMQDMRLEISAPGKGDARELSFACSYGDGSSTTDFTFVGAEEIKAKEYETLPCAYDETDSLLVLFEDKQRHVQAEITFLVFENCDVISRRTRIINTSEGDITLERVMSGQLDFADSGYILTTFHGAWAREMRRVDVHLVQGKYVSGSTVGASSATANPFFMLSRPQTTETQGEAYGFNLVYSGNHYEAAEVNEFGKTRLVWGIHPETFSWKLAPGEVFEAPEAVLSYGAEGFGSLSHNMHRFVRKHIVRGTWRDKARPVLLNSWEAAYFNINESKLLRLAKAGKEAGIELFVMDDGWFGERNDDTSSLGDWEVNKKKLPGGITGLANKIHGMGLRFGIWVEPEMVNEKSKLYKSHPDWTLEIPGQPHSEGRNQRILDLSKEEVQDYIIESMSRVFSGGVEYTGAKKNGPVDYVKWDMNRVMSDVYSRGGEPERQKETAHRYILGLYCVMRELKERFPGILFEGCASGGNRFDLGVLSYIHQIWASDDTDAIARAEIQNGYSYGYPMSVVGAHVSSVPNHQTLRITPLSTRFAVAAYGVLGYECNFCDLKKEELAEITAQIALYKEWRKVFFFGEFYRGRSFTGQYADRKSASVLERTDENVMEWTVVSTDKTRAVSMLLQRQIVPNMQNQWIYPQGLSEKKNYKFTSNAFRMNLKIFGDLVNTVAPVHIKQDSAAHSLLAKFVKLDGEKEDIKAPGDALMYGGVPLAPAYGGTGFNDKTRVFPDYAARLYFMEATDDENNE